MRNTENKNRYERLKKEFGMVLFYRVWTEFVRAHKLTNDSERNYQEFRRLLIAEKEKASKSEASNNQLNYTTNSEVTQDAIR